MVNVFNLIIVDPQHDFTNPNGSLYVPGAETAMSAIYKYIEKNHRLIKNIIITRDNHPAGHSSFNQWPAHCVANTPGAAVDPVITDILKKFPKLPVHTVMKGEDPDKDEYSAFGREYLPVNINLHKKDIVIVCGVAGDVCVKHTIYDLIWKHNMTVFAFIDGIVSISDKAFNDFLEEYNIPKLTL